MNERVKMVKMDSLIEFVGMFFYKDQKYDCEDFDDWIWEKSWEDITIDIVPKKYVNDEIIPNSLNQVKFNEDCFAMRMETIISLSPTSHLSGMEHVIEGVGKKDVFESFELILLVEGLKQFAAASKINESKPIKIGTLILDGPSSKEKPDLIRILTVWSYTCTGDGEDCEDWNFEGILEHNKISSIIIKIPPITTN